MSFPGAQVLQGGRPIAALVGLSLLACMTGAAMLLIPAFALALGLAVGAIALPTVALLASSWRATPRAGGPVAVGPEGVFVAGRLEIPRAAVQRALVARGARGVTVVIERRRHGPVVIQVDREEEGRRIVAALGLDPAAAVSEFSFDAGLATSLPRPLFYACTVLAMVVAPLVILRLFASGAVSLALLGVVPWCLSLLLTTIPTRLTVGLDGIVISWLGGRRLVRFSELRSCEVEGDVLRLTRRDGRVERLVADWQAYHAHSQEGVVGFGSKRAYLDAVAARVSEALEASRDRRAGLATGQLERASRPVAAWVRELRGLLVDRAAGFREGAALPEHFWGTVEDAQAPAEIRAAAATALAPTLDPEGRQRLRVIASVAVTPGLRVALEAAAAEDDQALEEALAAVCDPPSSALKTGSS
jgi:hypothetical protein